MKSTVLTMQKQCAHCAYFGEDQGETGFCRLHKMYVLQTFDCSKFTLMLPAEEQGGDVATQAERLLSGL